MTHPRDDTEAGATLVELTVALSVTALVVGMAYGSYTFAADLLARWRVRSAVQSTAHLILVDVSQHLRDAATIRRAGDMWTFVSHDGIETRYHLRDARLLRNGTPMHGPSVQVTAFRVSAVDAPTERARATTKGQGRRPLLQLCATVCAARDTVTVETTVQLRRSAAWGSPLFQDLSDDATSRF